MLFYSNVFNMIDWLANGVEPCTGMYIQNIKLVHISANNLQGPNLDIFIRFNQFSQVNDGFGAGWEFNLSKIETEDGVQTLILSDGRRYRMTETDNVIALQYKQANDFTIQKKSDNTYLLTNKSNTIETITDGKCTEISYPNGKKISLGWNTPDGLLLNISDDNKKTFLTAKSVTASSTTTVTVNTFNGIFVYSIKLTAGLIPSLCSIAYTPPAPEKPVQLYSVEYTTHNTSYLLITSFTSDIKYHQKEIVTYTPLPGPEGLDKTIYSAMTLKKILTADDLAPSCRDIIYNNPKSNYLGSGQVTAWKQDEDNLQFLPDDFYFTHTTQEGSERTTWCDYNKFYLQIREEPMLTTDTPSAGSSTTRKFKVYDYDLVANSTIAAQPPSFMFPITQHNNVQQRLQGKIKSRTALIQFKYDTFANLVEFVDVTGIKETCTYYPAAGEIDSVTGRVLCPPDPTNSINYIKERTITPFPGAPYSTLTRLFHYEYLSSNNLILLSTEQFYEITVDGKRSLLKQNIYSYDSSTLFSGQPSQLTEGMPPFTQDEAGNEIPAQSTRFNYSRTLSSDNSTLTTTKTNTGFDGQSITDSVTQATTTGAVVSSTDKNQLTSTFKYDALGLLVDTTCADSNGNKKTTTISYDPLHNKITTRHSSNQFSEIQVVDGLGNLTQEWLMVPSATTPTGFNIRAFSYNALNQLISKTEYDYTQDNVLLSTEITQTTWNIFDEPIAEKNADKSKKKYQYNYIKNTCTELCRPGRSKIISRYNDQDQLIMRSTYPKHSSMGADITEIFSHDGFWRLRKYLHTGQEDQQYEYDAFDRQIRQTGSVSGIKLTSHATHTSADCPTAITLSDVDGSNSKVIGQQYYDGLNRKIESSTNGSITTYNYSGTPLFDSPLQVTSGRQYNYEYNALFNQATKRSVRYPTGASSLQSQQVFSYDVKTGLLSESETASATPTEHFYSQLKYDQFNHLNHETSVFHQQYQAWHVKSETAATLTVKGKPLQSTTTVSYAEGMKFNPAIDVKTVYSYEKDGAIQQVDYYINAILATRSIFHRAANGNLTHIENYMQWPNARYARIDKRIAFTSYNLIDTITYQSPDERENKEVFGSHCILREQYQYDRQQRLSRLYCRFETSPPQTSTENYRYDRKGQLVTWKKRGDLLYSDSHYNRLFYQKFSYDLYGNLLDEKTEYHHPPSQGASNIATYSYKNISTLVSISNKTVNASPTPANIQFTTDNEGNVIERLEYAADGAMTKSVSYRFTGDNNFSSITEKFIGRNIKYEHYHYYDSYNRHISTVIRYAEDPQDKHRIVKSKIYAGDVPLIEDRYVLKDKNNIEHTVYHYVNGEVMFISLVDSKKNIKTFPCLNQADGTLLAQGYPVARRVYWYKYEPTYKFRTTGKNAYGLAMGLSTVQFSIPRMYPIDALPDQQ